MQRLVRSNTLWKQLLGTSNRQVTLSEAVSTSVIREVHGAADAEEGKKNQGGSFPFPVARAADNCQLCCLQSSM